MKRFLAFLLLFSSLTVSAQSVQDLFEDEGTPFYWLGVDFTHVKLIGDFSDWNGPWGGTTPKTAEEVRDAYFKSWNNLVLSERDKFDIEKFFRKDEVKYLPKEIMELNASANVDELEGYQVPGYSAADIKKFVSSYDFEEKEGIGLLLLAEALNKNEEEATFHFVALNMNNNEVLLQDKFVTEPSGIGLRNYWGNSIFRVLDEIGDDRYKDWRKEYKQ